MQEKISKLFSVIIIFSPLESIWDTTGAFSFHTTSRTSRTPRGKSKRVSCVCASAYQSRVPSVVRGSPLLPVRAHPVHSVGFAGARGSVRKILVSVGRFRAPSQTTPRTKHPLSSMSLALASSSLALNVAPRSGPVKAVAAEPVASKADFAYGLPVRRRHAPRSRLPARAHSPPAPAPLLLSPHPL